MKFCNFVICWSWSWSWSGSIQSSLGWLVGRVGWKTTVLLLVAGGTAGASAVGVVVSFSTLAFIQFDYIQTVTSHSFIRSL